MEENLDNRICFNKPCYSKHYTKHIDSHFENNDSYITKCEQYMKKKYDFENTIFTTSCTHSLEMMAMILNIGIGDEIIVPSYTFVSTANAFVKFGAKIIFLDSNSNDPNMNIDMLEDSITEKTKAVVIVHYAGWSVDMFKLQKLCKNKKIFLLEDAAQAINCSFVGKPLGSFGTLSAFSFHYTKNIHCGEGGMLVINDPEYINKAHIICDKGTNRHDFLKNKIDKYEWVDRGSSYPMSEINAAYLYGQLVDIDNLIKKRKQLWKLYHDEIKSVKTDLISYTSSELETNIGNYHIYYIVFKQKKDLSNLQRFLKNNKIQTFTHYRSLHLSEYSIKNNLNKKSLPNSENLSECLLRLPLHQKLLIEDVNFICTKIKSFYSVNMKSLTYQLLSLEEKNDIIQLKKQFWQYDYDSQIEWMNQNIKNDDINVMIYNCYGELVGYCLIMKRSCHIVDSFIVDAKYRGCGFGRGLMGHVMNIIDTGFLLCETKNILFYEKLGWNLDNTVVVKNKQFSPELHKMTFNKNYQGVSY